MWHEREREREHNSPPCKIVHGGQFTFKLVYVHGTIKLVLKDFIMHLLMFPVNTQLETIVVESLDGVPERYSATRGKKKNTKKNQQHCIFILHKKFRKVCTEFLHMFTVWVSIYYEWQCSSPFPSWLFMTGDLQIYLEAQHAIAMLYTTTTIYIKVVY